MAPSISTATAPDDVIAQMVLRAIRQRVAWPAGLSVIAEQSIVTLRGCTRSFYEKQLMLHAAQRVPGVNRIVDEVQVLPQ